MASRPKTRFVVTVSGKDRELFSIVERPGGDLLLMPRTTNVAEDSDGTRRTIVETHFSIHPSDRSNGTTVKRTSVEDGSGRIVETATFVPDSTRTLLTLIYCTRQWRMSAAFLLAGRSKDKIVNVGSFDERLTTLIYTVWVCADTREGPPAPPGSIAFSAGFRRFTIIAYITYIPVPAAPVGSTHYLMTSKPRIDGGSLEHTHSGGTISDEEFPSMLRDFWEFARQDYLKRSAQALGPDHRSLPALIEFSGRYGQMAWAAGDGEVTPPPDEKH